MKSRGTNNLILTFALSIFTVGLIHSQTTEVTLQEVDKIMYFKIRADTRSEYADFMVAQFDTLYRDYVREKAVSDKLYDTNKKKDILLQNSDATANFYREESKRISENCERNVRKANLIGTVKAVGTGIIGLAIGYVAYAIIN